MELRTLRSFVVLAEHRHFTRAAGELGVVQPALSKHIQALEDELGVRLFERTRRTVRLSRAGERLLEPAMRVLRDADDLRDMARRWRDGFLGQIRVGFTPTAPAKLLSDAVEAFRRAHPAVAAVVSQDSSERLLDALGAGTMDVVLVRLDSAARRTGVRSVPVSEEPLVAALPRRHPLARRPGVRLADLAAEPFVMVRREAAASVFDQIIGACRAAGFSPRLSRPLRDVHGVVAVVGTGAGVSIVPASTPRLVTVAFRPLLGTPLRTSLGIAWATARESADVRAFVDAVRSLSARRPPARAGSR